MKLKQLLIIFLFATCAFGAGAWVVPKENLSYDVMYKWGMVNKKAGDVSINTTAADASNNFSAQLTGKSASWADPIFMLRDTLKGNINAVTFLPSYYEKIAHEGGGYERDLLRYKRVGDKTHADAERWRRKKKDVHVTKSETTYDTEGLTLDMLSSFYYMRQFDYGAMNRNHVTRLNVLSGSKQEYLTITYKGVELIEIGKTKYPAYHITFSFTQDGGTVSSDPMDAWIYAHPCRVPILMEGKLPVGKVRAVLSSQLPD